MDVRLNRVPRFVAALLFGGLLLFGLFGALLKEAVLPIAYHLSLGWYLFPSRVLPQVAVSWAGLFTALICFVLFGLGLHSFLSWLYIGFQQPNVVKGSPTHRWKERWSISILAMIFLMFSVGLCAIVISHQTIWLFKGKEPLIKFEQKRTVTPD